MKKLHYRPILLFLIWVPLYAYWGSPLSPLSETLTLVSKYHSLQTKLFYGSAYLGVAFIGALSMFALAFAKSKKALAVFIILALYHCFDLSYHAITNTWFSVSDYIFLVKEIGNTFWALEEFKFIIFKFIIIVTVFILSVIALRRFFTFTVRFGLHWVLLALAYAAAVCSLHVSEGKRDNYVSPIRVPAIVMYSHIFPEKSGINIPYTQRVLEASAQPAQKPMARHILFIIDESVVGQYLSINGYPLETTPYLTSIQNEYINLGCVTSVANLSMSSNYILRNGVLPAQLPDLKHSTLAAPSIFNYAQRAGMHTALLDAQLQVQTLQNYLSLYDLEAIDTYAYFPATDKRYDNDFVAIDKVKQIQSQNDSSFILLVKYGPHFPYQDRYPKENAVFKPDLLTSKEFADPYETPAGRIMAINTYLNALRWNVDYFFDVLLTQIAPDTLVVYTADHGQSLLHAEIRTAHGSKGAPPAAQVSVPLLLFPKARLSGLFSQIDSSGASYSQYQIFPTLLKMMGYDDTVTQKYGPALWQGSMEQKTFTGSLFQKSGLVSLVPAKGAKTALPDGNYAETRNAGAQ